MAAAANDAPGQIRGMKRKFDSIAESVQKAYQTSLDKAAELANEVASLAVRRTKMADEHKKLRTDEEIDKIIADLQALKESNRAKRAKYDDEQAALTAKEKEIETSMAVHQARCTDIENKMQSITGLIVFGESQIHMPPPPPRAPREKDAASPPLHPLPQPAHVQQQQQQQQQPAPVPAPALPLPPLPMEPPKQATARKTSILANLLPQKEAAPAATQGDRQLAKGPARVYDVLVYPDTTGIQCYCGLCKARLAVSGLDSPDWGDHVPSALCQHLQQTCIYRDYNQNPKVNYRYIGAEEAKKEGIVKPYGVCPHCKAVAPLAHATSEFMKDHMRHDCKKRASVSRSADVPEPTTSDLTLSEVLQAGLMSCSANISDVFVRYKSGDLRCRRCDYVEKYLGDAYKKAQGQRMWNHSARYHNTVRAR